MSEIVEPSSAAAARPGDDAPKPRAPLWLAVVLVDAAAFVLGILPAMILGFGIQAIGARNEWWIGDPNSNDGEETFATFLGLVGALPLLTGTIIAVAVAARKRSRPAALLNAVNTLAFVAVFTILCIWWFQPAPLAL
jgi:hypothetical protein